MKRHSSSRGLCHSLLLGHGKRVEGWSSGRVARERVATVTVVGSGKDWKAGEVSGKGETKAKVNSPVTMAETAVVCNCENDRPGRAG